MRVPDPGDGRPRRPIPLAAYVVEHRKAALRGGTYGDGAFHMSTLGELAAGYTAGTELSREDLSEYVTRAMGVLTQGIYVLNTQREEAGEPLLTAEEQGELVAGSVLDAFMHGYIAKELELELEREARSDG